MYVTSKRRAVILNGQIISDNKKKYQKLKEIVYFVAVYI